ncbi:MAG: C39 family peptidase [Anaerolineae bacterium]
MRYVWVCLAVIGSLILARPVSATGPSSIPPQYYLPAHHFWQSRNNCGPTSVAMAASVFGVTVDPEDARRVLRPEPESIGMDPIRVPGYVQSLGLAARPRVNGDLDTLRRLIAADVPVIVLQWLTLSQSVDHYRLVVGYDTQAHVLLINDSTYGAYLRVPEDEFLALWTPGGRQYIPVYRAQQSDRVAEIVGADWEDTSMYRRAFDAALKDLQQAPNDPWAWLRLGTYAYFLDNPRTAITCWRTAWDLGLPEADVVIPGRLALAELDLSEYTSALAYGQMGLTRSPSAAGLYYVIGRAYAGMGAASQAGDSFRRALQLEPSFSPAKSGLEMLSNKGAAQP